MSWGKTPHGPPPLLGGAGKHLGHDGQVSDRARQNLERIKAGKDLPPSMQEKHKSAPTPEYGENKRKRQVREQEEAAESPDAEKMGNDGNWIAGATKNKGAFKAKAKAAGESTKEFAEEKKHAPGKTGKQARLAETLMGMDGAPDKMKMTMDEFKAGQLHSGSKTGPKVTNRKQAIAIGINQAKKAGQKP
jgi:uncharacterized protein DUF6496